jgi:predicted RNA polymerase sigma factor
VGGLTTAEIAKAFLVPESTLAQRISRAKQSIKASGVPFQVPGERERGERLGAVLHVLYLIFNEGYTSSGGAELQRTDLSNEAIRLTRAVHALLPDDGEVAGLLALMLLTDARRAARSGPNGEIIPLPEQDRGLWDQGMIAEGVALVTAALSKGSVGAYQLQAAIAAVHEAASAEETDWPQIPPFTVSSCASRTIQWHPEPCHRHVTVHGPAAGLSGCGARRRRTAGRSPPAGRRPRPPAGAGRRPRERRRFLPEGRRKDGQRP